MSCTKCERVTLKLWFDLSRLGLLVRTARAQEVGFPKQFIQALAESWVDCFVDAPVNRPVCDTNQLPAN